MYILVVLTTLLGIGLRVIGLNKTQGLWNDEYISWFVASQPFGEKFFREVFAQCHMPFYYLYLKFFMLLNGDGDLFLRFTSLISGVLSIIVMYFAGLQNNRKTGLICAFFTSISSFLIYYSQEVRMYSLLFLLSALSLLYMLKFIKGKNFVNLGGLVLFDSLIMFTHTIGFVFVFFQIAALSVLLFKEYRKYLLIMWGSLALLFVISIPQIMKIFTTHSFSQWWGHFSLSKIGFLFTDYFSPVLTNLVNAPDELVYVKSFSFVFFTFVPAIIAVFFIIKAVINNRENFALFSAAAGFVLLLTGAALLGKLVFITKYSIEIYPILLYLAAFGACSFKYKELANCFIAIYCLINLTYIVTSPVSAPKMPRLQGHKIVADLLNRAEVQDGDFIILEYYPKMRFEKYFDFSKYVVYSIDKGSFPFFLTPDKDYSQIVSNGKTEYKEMFASAGPGYLDYKITEYVLKNIKQGQNVHVVMADSVSFYSPSDITRIVNNTYLYEKTPIMYLIFSYIKYRVIKNLSKSLVLTRYEKMGDWSVVRFTKLNK